MTPKRLARRLSRKQNSISSSSQIRIFCCTLPVSEDCRHGTISGMPFAFDSTDCRLSSTSSLISLITVDSVDVPFNLVLYNLLLSGRSVLRLSSLIVMLRSYFASQSSSSHARVFFNLFSGSVEVSLRWESTFAIVHFRISV